MQRKNIVSKFCLMLGFLIVFQDGDVWASKRGGSKKAAGSRKRFSGISKKAVSVDAKVVSNQEVEESVKEDASVPVPDTPVVTVQDNTELINLSKENAQMSADLSAAQDKIDKLELDALQKNVTDKQIENQKATARTLAGDYSNAITEVQNKCSGVGSGFNKVLSSLGFATVTSSLSALGSAAVITGEFTNRSTPKMEKTMDIAQKVGSAVSSVSSVASTVSVATATKNMESAISKLKVCRTSISEFQKVVNKISDEADGIAQQENYDENVYDKLNGYVSTGNKIISTCNGLNEKDSNDVLKMMKASTAVSAVGSAAAVAGAALEVVSAVKEKKGEYLGKNQRIGYTASNIGSSVASLGTTILNGVAQSKLKKIAQSAVDCEQIIK